MSSSPKLRTWLRHVRQNTQQQISINPSDWPIKLQVESLEDRLPPGSLVTSMLPATMAGMAMGATASQSKELRQERPSEQLQQATNAEQELEDLRRELLSRSIVPQQEQESETEKEVQEETKNLDLEAGEELWVAYADQGDPMNDPFTGEGGEYDGDQGGESTYGGGGGYDGGTADPSSGGGASSTPSNSGGYQGGSMTPSDPYSPESSGDGGNPGGAAQYWDGSDPGAGGTPGSSDGGGSVGDYGDPYDPGTDGAGDSGSPTNDPIDGGDGGYGSPTDNPTDGGNGGSDSPTGDPTGGGGDDGTGGGGAGGGGTNPGDGGDGGTNPTGGDDGTEGDGDQESELNLSTTYQVITTSQGGAYDPSHFMVQEVNDQMVTDITMQIDLNGNGEFDDPGESGYDGFSEVYFSESHGEFHLDTLPNQDGFYQFRAKAIDVSGETIVSNVVTVHVDHHVGYIGSEHLRLLGFYWGEIQAGVDNGDFTYDEYMLKNGLSAGDLIDLVSIDSQDRVLISARAIELSKFAQFESDLLDLNMKIIDVSPEQQLISGYFPIEQLGELGSVDNFSSAAPVYNPVTRVGSALTQADAVILGPDFRASESIDGAGITVGVLSDSVDQVDSDNDNVTGIAESQATGDLPSRGVNVLRDNPNAFGGNPTDEGRAMLEIVHDIAPGADLAFHSTDTPQVFADGIRALAAAGARSIVDDIGFFVSPIFNDGVIAQAADDVVADGNFYASAAGNNDTQAWESAYSGASGTVGGVTGNYHDFGGGDLVQEFTLPAGGQLIISFQWDDAYLEGGSALPNFQVTTDMEVIITNAAGALQQRTNDDNAALDQAAEIVGFTSNAGGTFGLSFRLAGGPAPTQLKWISFGDDPQAQDQGAPTAVGQVVAAGTTAVGAVPFFDPASPEPFTSSGGPLQFFFDRDGNRLANPEVRNKPEIAAPDGGNTSFFGQDSPQDPDNLPNFFGTSAAAPAAAAAAALIFAQESTFSGEEVEQHLRDTAIDIVTGPAGPGFDVFTGDGLIQLRPVDPNAITVEGDDNFEDNDSSDRATEFSSISVRLTDATISTKGTLGDLDWYRLPPASRDGQFRAGIAVTESTGTLELQVFRLVQGTLQLVGNTSAGEGGVANVTAAVSAGDVLFVHVKGTNSAPGVMDTGTYDLRTSLR